jgi:molybdopterin-biosynthesis enzyme MoeA-like protein
MKINLIGGCRIMDQLICKLCGLKFEESETIFLKGKGTYCHSCFNTYMQERTYKTKLDDYICKKLEIEKISSLIATQIKQLHHKGFNNKQILFGFWYTYIHLKKLNKKYYNTIGYMFYFMEDAIKFANDNNKDLEQLDKDYFIEDRERILEEQRIKTEQKKQQKIERMEFEVQQRKNQEVEQQRILREKAEAEEKLKQEGLLYEKQPATTYTEYELEDYLVDNLNLIEKGLKYIDRQVPVSHGIIDILARDKNDELCIIELKIEEDASRLIWQCSYYPTQFNEPSRMITVAPGYSERIEIALKTLT